MVDQSTYTGLVLGISPEKDDFFPNDPSNLSGFELGLNGDSENLFPDDSKVMGFCLGLGETVPFMNHSSVFEKLT